MNIAFRIWQASARHENAIEVLKHSGDIGEYDYLPAYPRKRMEVKKVEGVRAVLCCVACLLNINDLLPFFNWIGSGRFENCSTAQPYAFCQGDKTATILVVVLKILYCDQTSSIRADA